MKTGSFRDWVVVKSPIGKFGKVRAENLKLIPKTWKIMTKTNCVFYFKNGSLTERAQGLLTISNPTQVRELGDRFLYDTGLVIGKIYGV